MKAGSSLLGNSSKRLRQEKEQDMSREMDTRESSVSTVNANVRDHDMTDDRTTHSEPDLLSKFSAGYRYVSFAQRGAAHLSIFRGSTGSI